MQTPKASVSEKISFNTSNCSAIEDTGSGLDSVSSPNPAGGRGGQETAIDNVRQVRRSEQQLLEISASEDDRLQELRKSHKIEIERGSLNSEAVQKQHSMDSAAFGFCYE
ncbi:hypothetical protein V6N13_141703 [Hibiscus sabdariffa]|uniref:Uncharacterized protein n=1 Tax=Hibiscus sabdariffa TaxID=183260 RepID=A0ABR2BCY2_9ROSI